MDPADNPSTPLSSLQTDDVQKEIRSLRLTVTLLLAATACMGASLTVYLYGQVATLSRQVTDGKRYVNDFQSNAIPKINWFVVNLNAFAKTNPDFTPILAKYNLLQAPAPVAPAGTNLPIAQPPAKK